MIIHEGYSDESDHYIESFDKLVNYIPHNYYEIFYQGLKINIIKCAYI